MLDCPFYWVDAFTMGPFTGNPAGVCPLDSWPSDQLLQKIAHQNGLAETAFFVPVSSGLFHLRWFTPSVEIDLCGHATLAAAHVLFNELDYDQDEVTFQTQSGELVVSRETEERIALDFPSRPASPIALSEIPTGLLSSLGLTASDIEWVGLSRDWLIVLRNESILTKITPDFPALRAVKTAAVIISAPSKESDFVSRFFAPDFGVPEDHVTGSAHCTLIPYWSNKLQKNPLTAIQRSSRGGQLWCEQRGERVSIAGHAKSYIKGKLSV